MNRESGERDLRLAIEVLKREGLKRVDAAALNNDMRHADVAESLGRVVTDLRRMCGAVVPPERTHDGSE